MILQFYLLLCKHVRTAKPTHIYTRCSIYAPSGIIDAVVILHRKEKPQVEVFGS